MLGKLILVPRAASNGLRRRRRNIGMRSEEGSFVKSGNQNQTESQIGFSGRRKMITRKQERRNIPNQEKEMRDEYNNATITTSDDNHNENSTVRNITWDELDPSLKINHDFETMPDLAKAVHSFALQKNWSEVTRLLNSFEERSFRVPIKLYGTLVNLLRKSHRYQEAGQMVARLETRIDG